jgi:hypothetical protein
MHAKFEVFFLKTTAGIVVEYENSAGLGDVVILAAVAREGVKSRSEAIGSPQSFDGFPQSSKGFRRIPPFSAETLY